MAENTPRKRRRLPLKKIIFWTGAGIILLGYWLLSIPPDTDPSVVVHHAFNGMAAVIIGAMLSIGAIFSPRVKS